MTEQSELDVRPTALGARRCAEWLTACREIGWRAEDMPFLCGLFWKYKDKNGNLKGEKP